MKLQKKEKQKFNQINHWLDSLLQSQECYFDMCRKVEFKESKR